MDYTITDSHALHPPQDKLTTHNTCRNTINNHTIDKHHSISNKELRLEQPTANSIVIKTEFDPDSVSNINYTNNYNSEKWNSDVRIKSDPCGDRFTFSANGDKLTISDQIERIIKMEDMSSCNEDNGEFQNGDFIVGACSNRIDDFDRIRNMSESIDECRNSVSNEFAFRNRLSEDFSDKEFGGTQSNLDEFSMSNRLTGGECLAAVDRHISVDEFGNKVMRSGGEEAFRVRSQEKRKMADMLVRRGLKRFAMKPGHKTAAEVDEIFTDW